MFDNCKNTKQQGNIGLGQAIAWFIQNQYTVSIPINDSQDYDLVVEKDNKLLSVQVKTSGYKGKSGNYEVGLKSTGGNSGKVLKTFDKYQIDLLFILCGDGTKYLIPREDITNTSGVTLVEYKYGKYKI